MVLFYAVILHQVHQPAKSPQRFKITNRPNFCYMKHHSKITVCMGCSCKNLPWQNGCAIRFNLFFSPGMGYKLKHLHFYRMPAFNNGVY